MPHLELKGLKGLRGLDSLLGDSKLQKNNVASLLYVPIEVLQPGKNQPRRVIHQMQLEELAVSIKSQGIIQPLIVRKLKNHDRYEIIAGERRWRAAKISGLVEVPVIVREVEDNTALAFGLIENLQREDLNPIEEALSFTRLQEEFGMTHADISEIIGRSRTAITNSIRLLSLSDPIKELLSIEKLDMGHARALLTLSSEDQLFVAQKIVENGLSVRETENLVQTVREATTITTSPPKMHKHAKINYWQETLSHKLNAKVVVNLKENGLGKIVIHVESPEEVDWFMDHLKIE